MGGGGSAGGGGGRWGRLGNKGISEYGRREATCEESGLGGWGTARLCWDLFVCLVFYSPAPLNLFIFIWYSEQSAAQSQTTASLQTPKRLSLPLVSRTKKQTNKPTLRALGPFKMRGIQFFLRDGEGQKIISIRPTTPRPTNSPVLSRMTALPVSSHLPRRCSGAQGRSAHADFPAVRGCSHCPHNVRPRGGQGVCEVSPCP